MNAERLLAHFERISEAQDAIARLRRFILDLAVRGKLVEQDPEDEPAEEMLHRIRQQKKRMVISGEIKKAKEDCSASSSAQQLKVPCGWSTCRLDEAAICLDYMRKPVNGLERQRRIEGKTQEELFPYFGATQQQGWIDNYLFDDELVLLGEDGVPFFDALRAKAYLIAGKAWVNNHAHVFKPILTQAAYLVHCLNVFDYSDRVAGATRSKLNQSKAVDIPIPLPPLAEQHRIVAKVDELMALCDQLEAARQQREQSRECLVAATLQRLNQPAEDPASFRKDASFALQVLASLTTTPAQIKQLRQTILNLAVRGKLVEQDPEDEPVPLLLVEIKSRMRRLRLNHAFSVIDPSEIPFDEPSGWIWCRLGEVCEKTGSGSTPRGGKDVYKNSGVPFLRSQNIYDDGLRLEDVAFIDDLTHERMAGTRVLPCDLLLNITGGSIGRCAKVPLDLGVANISQHVAIIRLAAQGMEHFFHSLILSPYFQGFVDKSQTGAGRGGLPKNRMDAIPVPLPPLAEQHRIVAKVDELMALCDQLEQQLRQADQQRRRLLEAVLEEALGG